MSKLGDALAILEGFKIVFKAFIEVNNRQIKHIWINSSLKDLLDNGDLKTANSLSNIIADPSKEVQVFKENVKETLERSSMALEGFKQLSTHRLKTDYTASSEQSTTFKDSKNIEITDDDISSLTIKELEHTLKKRNNGRIKKLKSISTTSDPPDKNLPVSNKSSDSDETYVENLLKLLTGKHKKTEIESEKSQVSESFQQENESTNLLSVAKQRKVPSSRIGRMATFGKLFAGLGLGTVNELTKGALGLGGTRDLKEALLSPNNTERIVDTLCRVRGAALKLGQILSIQDSSVISPQLAKAFERVRQAADYMPDWQLERVMQKEFGVNWRNNFDSFEQIPFAAASIGQVHKGKLLDGTDVAVKIQYPGVAVGIESDIDNLIGMLKIWDIFPPGFFIDNIVKVAKRELKWEVDYIREADFTENYKNMVLSYKEYYVPKVYRELTTSSVLTTEMVPGIPLDKCFDIRYEERKFIAEYVLKLCLRELFQWHCMQTDPNWSNFLYDSSSRRLMLIDFGSTRFYSKDFIEKYREIICAAVHGNREKVLQYSQSMGFLTGYETKQMNETHINAVMILGEIFRFEGDFDFGKQDTTQRISKLIPKMVAYRLCAPPEEIYSIHRKLSGVFLLCSRLQVKMDCRPYYDEIIKK